MRSRFDKRESQHSSLLFPKTAYFQRLREIIVTQLEQESHEVFAGEIEVDVSYFANLR